MKLISEEEAPTSYYSYIVRLKLLNSQIELSGVLALWKLMVSNYVQGKFDLIFPKSHLFVFFFGDPTILLNIVHYS